MSRWIQPGQACRRCFSFDIDFAQASPQRLGFGQHNRLAQTTAVNSLSRNSSCTSSSATSSTSKQSRYCARLRLALLLRFGERAVPVARQSENRNTSAAWSAAADPACRVRLTGDKRVLFGQKCRRGNSLFSDRWHCLVFRGRLGSQPYRTLSRRPIRTS